MTKTINETTEQRTIDYILHWGEQHELFNEAYEENHRRNPHLYSDKTCDNCGSDNLSSNSSDEYACNNCGHEEQED